MPQGMNHAANLPALNNDAIHQIIGPRIAEYAIAVYRYTLPIHLFVHIDSDVDLCREIIYLCEDHSDVPNMSDSAVNGPIKRKTLAPPKIKKFQGFCKGGFETKLAIEQLECINSNPVLSQWYQNQLMMAVENGKTAISARFYRHMIAHAHPRNSGNNAGLLRGGNVLGERQQPVKFDVDNADKWFTSIVATAKQMPDATPMDNEYGKSTDDLFIFGPTDMEAVLMRVPEYNQYNLVGECGSCAMFTDVFNRMPRGVMPITSNCVESYTCESGGSALTVYPVLFGKRYMGTKAAVRVKSKTYGSLDGDSLFHRTQFYHHIHTYDCRFLGVSYITIETEQPATVQGCA